MKYDLLIKNGTVIDGTGASRFEADVGIVGDQITAIGTLGTDAKELIDARDKIVSAGFVDAHTHMDAQIFWDPLGTCSCLHGVTSVVMGNCGFTLAPVNVEDLPRVYRGTRRSAQGHQLRRLCGSFRVTHVCHARAFVYRAGHPRGSTGDGRCTT